MPCNVDIFYQNARGLRTKTLEFFSNVLSSSFPIIAISETWLGTEIPSSDFFPPTYTTFRRDRDFSETKQKGGGVLIAIDNSLKSVRRKDLETIEESIWLEINLERREKLLIGCFYLPPSISPASFHDVMSSIELVISSHSGHRIIVLGDFNAPGIDWSTLTFSHYNHFTEKKCSLLLDFLAFNSLVQHNSVVNSSGNVLDLCVSNDQPLEVSRSNISLVRPDKFHPPLNVRLSASAETTSYSSYVNKSPRFAFKRGDYTGLYHHLSTVEWSQVTDKPNVDDQVDRFTELVLSSMLNFIPQYTPKQRKYPHWFSSELISALKHKDHAHRKSKCSPSSEWKEEFSFLQRKLL